MVFIDLPIDCKWSEYGDWAQCSATCGKGMRERTRTVVQEASNGGAECSGSDKESEDCTGTPCGKDLK